MQELARRAELLGIAFRVHSTSPLTTQLAMVLYAAMRQMPELTRFMTGVDMYSYGMAVHLGRLGTILVTPEAARIITPLASKTYGTLLTALRRKLAAALSGNVEALRDIAVIEHLLTTLTPDYVKVSELTRPLLTYLATNKLMPQRDIEVMTLLTLIAESLLTGLHMATAAMQQALRQAEMGGGGGSGGGEEEGEAGYLSR